LQIVAENCGKLRTTAKKNCRKVHIIVENYVKLRKNAEKAENFQKFRKIAKNCGEVLKIAENCRRLRYYGKLRKTA
jgi:hypothetical protein